MAEERFDPGGFYELDLARGQLLARGGGPVVALDREVVAGLLRAVVEGDGEEPVARLGARLGAAVDRTFGDDAASRHPEAVAGRVADILGVLGWGRVVFERWGEALTLRWADLPVSPRVAAPLLSGVLSALADREVACVAVSDERFVAVDPAIAGTVREWAESGADAATVAGRLHGREGGASA